MSEVTCPAGHVFTLGSIPSPTCSVLISEQEMDGLAARVVEATKSEEPADSVWMQIWTAGTDAYTCPVCHRFFLCSAGTGEILASYVKE